MMMPRWHQLNYMCCRSPMRPLAALVVVLLAAATLPGLAVQLRRRQPAAVDASAAPTSGFSPYTHTLVQYLSSSTCMSDRYVCLQLRLGRTTQVGLPERHGGNSVCNKLTSVEEETTFRLDSCYPPAAGCGPTACDACAESSLTKPYNLGECHGEVLPGGIASSLKLLEGDAATNKLKCSTMGLDLGLARWCDKWPSKTGGKEKTASAKK